MEPLRDDDGQLVINAKEKVVQIRVINEPEAKIVREIHERYAGGESGETIARDLNDRKIEPGTWDGGKVRDFLDRDVYRGYEFRNKTRQIKDPKTGAVTTIKRPKADWKRREVPQLQLIEPELAEAVDRCRAESAAAYGNRKSRDGKPARSRKRQYPVTLIRPVCGCCGDELSFARGGKYRNYWCANGQTGKHGCTFRGSKSVRIVESSILEHVREHVLTETFITRLVDEANDHIMNQPEPDSNRLTVIRDELDAIADRLADLESKLEDDETFRGLETVLKAIARMEAKQARLRREERELRAQENTDVPLLTREDCETYLLDLRNLLGDEVHTAAPILHAILGDVVVEQQDMEDFKKPQWIAKFTLNGQAVVSYLTQKKTIQIANVGNSQRPLFGQLAMSKKSGCEKCRNTSRSPSKLLPSNAKDAASSGSQRNSV